MELLTRPVALTSDIPWTPYKWSHASSDRSGWLTFADGNLSIGDSRVIVVPSLITLASIPTFRTTVLAVDERERVEWKGVGEREKYGHVKRSR